MTYAYTVFCFSLVLFLVLALVDIPYKVMEVVLVELLTIAILD